MENAQKLDAWVASRVNDRTSYAPVPFHEIARQAFKIEPGVKMKQFKEFGQWFIAFKFMDDSAISYGIED